MAITEINDAIINEIDVLGEKVGISDNELNYRICSVSTRPIFILQFTELTNPAKFNAYIKTSDNEISCSVDFSNNPEVLLSPDEQLLNDKS